MQAKSIFTSRTFWFNIVGAVNVILSAFGAGVIPDEALAAGLVVGNTVLRLITKQPVSLV